MVAFARLRPRFREDVSPADKDDLVRTVNGKNRKLRAGYFRAVATTLGLTSVQYSRLTRRMVETVTRNLDEAIKRSFDSTHSLLFGIIRPHERQ